MNRVHGGWQRRYSMALHREENKVTLYAVTEVQTENPCPKYVILGQKIATEGQYGHFMKAEKVDGAFIAIMVRAISQLIAVIL